MQTRSITEVFRTVRPARIRPAIWALCLGVMAFATAASAASVTVIRSTAPDIKPGDVFDLGQRIELPQNTSVELVSIQGTRATLQGPYAGPVEVRGQPLERSRLDAVRDAIFGLDAGTRVLGATRRVPRPDEIDGGATIEPDRRPRVIIDVSTDGTWCVFDGLEVTLTRGEFGRNQGTLTALATSKQVELRWHHFLKEHPWPDDIPIENGAQYQVRNDGADPVVLTLRQVERGDNAAQDLVRMAAAGCTTQVGQAIAVLDEAPQAE